MEPAEERLRRGAERARAAADAHAAGALADALTDRDRLVGRRTKLVAELDDARSALRTREREREALTALRESRRAARERTERLLALRHQRLVELATERERLRREITDAETLVAAERDAFAAWPGQIEPLRSALQPLLAGDAELTGRIASRARELTNRERGRLEAELALRRAEQEQALAEEVLEREAGITPGEAEGIVGPEEGTPAPEQLEKQVRDLRTRIRGLGAVNAEAEADYHETSARYHFLAGQIADLKQAGASLVAAIEELRGIMRERFDAAFASINAGFERYFRGFFGGGQARLVLTDPGSGGEAGVEIAAQPPGKRLQNLTMLSGGERSMTSVALLFALLENHAAPFCVLDEVDAALDEANVARVGSSLTELARSSQFLVITHNRGTLQAANQIYGVSMNDDGISTVLSMRFDDAAPLLA